GDDLGAHGGATEIELHPHHAHVVGSGGAESHRARHRAASRGAGDGNGRRQIIHDREGDGGRRRAVPGSVPGLGDERVQPARNRPIAPATRVRRGDDLGTHGSATEIELHSHYTHVIGGRSAQSHFPRHRAAGRGAGHGNGRRLRVVEDGEGDRGGRGRV